jgi:hypothetical protein
VLVLGAPSGGTDLLSRSDRGRPGLRSHFLHRTRAPRRNDLSAVHQRGSAGTPNASAAEASQADLLRDARRRGMTAPVLAVGNGALGFWAALREALPAR